MDEDEQFREQCRRQLRRSVDQRIKYGFFKNYKPILDDESRSFETMAEYREWAHKTLPKYLGYRIASRKDD
jgi:hypothetical protein